MDNSQEYRDRRSEYTAATSRISATSRLIGFGLVALAFSVHSSETDFLQGISKDYFAFVNLFGGFGFLTILFDYLQFVFGAISIDMAMQQHDKEYSFDKRWFSYRMRKVSFWLKQIFAIFGILISIFCLSSAIFSQ